MKSRALKFKLLCGLEGCIPLDPTDLSEVDSAAEFISIIDKFRTGIRRFNDRNPMIKWSSSHSFREYTTLNDIIHDIVNSRRYMNFPNVDSSDYDQVFELDFTTESITLYSEERYVVSDDAPLTPVKHAELGTMHINAMFSNWKELFYPGMEEDSWVTAMDKEDEDFDESDIEIINEEESLYDYMRPKMKDQLGDKQMELWDLLMSNIEDTDLPENCTFKINYSGSGDSGDIDSFNICYDKGGSYVSGRIESHFVGDTTTEMYSLAWRVIDEEEPGFVNNDGGYGEIVISATKFSWEHYNYFTETNQTIAMDVDLEDKGIEIIHPLPDDVEEALSASAPETKAEVTLGDIVAEHHLDIKKMLEDAHVERLIYKSGSDFDFDKKPDFDQKPPELPF